MRRILVCISLLFVMTGASSQNVDITQHDGKVVLIDFWASWCVPCRRSFPWMNEMHDKYAEDGLVIVAVNLDNNIVDAATFLEKYPARFDIAYDNDKSLARKYDVQAMPNSFLIGRDGELVATHLGFKVKQQPEYEAAIVAALGELEENAE